MGFHQNKGTRGLAFITRERSKCNTTVKYSIKSAALVPFHCFLPINSVSDIYGLHPIPLVNNENNKGIFIFKKSLRTVAFEIFGDLLVKLRRKLSDFLGISHLNLQFLIIARAR